jgi:hypothetical protein
VNKRTYPLLAFAALLLAAPFILADVQVRDTANGLKIGSSSNAKIGFYGAEPVVQRTNAAQAALSGTSLKYLSFTGHNGAGACTVTGLSVGDTVVGVVDLTAPGGASSSFEATVTIANQLQQSSATNLSAHTLTVVADSGGGKTLINELRTALVNLGLIKGS